MSDLFIVTQLTMPELGFGTLVCVAPDPAFFFMSPPSSPASLGGAGKALKFCCLFGFVVLLIELPARISVNKLRKNKEKALSHRNWRKIK